MSRWLAIVGIGEDGPAGLSAVALARIGSAELLVGGRRHLAMIPDDGTHDRRVRMTWPSPLADGLPKLDSWRGRPVCVLASGDPLDHGIGAVLVERYPPEEILVVPQPSAFSLACARMGWPRQSVETVSLHGRPLEEVHAFIQPNARIVILCNNGDTPGEVAALLCRRGYGASELTVLEHMGGRRERRITGTADAWPPGRGADLATLTVACRADADAPIRPAVPGLPDDSFRHDGQLTKREIRAVTLAALAPGPGQLLWDVGAGCGSVAIEWLRSDRRCRAIAIEPDPGRGRLILENAGTLGCPRLKLVAEHAPEALVPLEAPDAVFIGGGLSDDGVLAACWRALKPGGRLVANVVTADGERVALDWRRRTGGTLVRLSIHRLAPLGGHAGWRPLMPVTQLQARKG